MRIAIAVLSLIPFAAGCLEDPLAPPAPGIPVISVESTMMRFDENGTQPFVPQAIDPCDPFEIRRAERKVHVEEEQRTQMPQSAPLAAVLTVPHRRVEGPQEDEYHRIRLGASLPVNETLRMGNDERAYNVTLSLTADGLNFNGAGIGPGHNQTQRFDYEWRRSDGSRLNVTELVRVEYLGDWPEPLVFDRRCWK